MITEPLNCPRCQLDLGEGDTTYGIVETDHNIAWQSVTCECGCSWRQEYDYTGLTFDDPEDLKPLRITFDIKNLPNCSGKGLYITVNEKGSWFRRYTNIPAHNNLHKDLEIVVRSMRLNHDLTNPDEPFAFSLIDVGGHLKCSQGDPVGVNVASEFTRNYLY